MNMKMGRYTSIFASAMVVLNLMTLINGQQLPNGGKIWALLVAGANGYENYRHEANVCHAYQILHANGIPDENIIVMMYDDIAYNSQNPNKGVIINWVGGPDVYQGVPIDYTDATVSAGNFLSVLSGDEAGMNGIGSGRVIKSGPNDHIFVYFSDHGATGLLGFPNNELLFASDLLATLKEMSVNEQFAKLVFYVEACDSGSLFENTLIDKLNIFAVTSARPHEPSYSCCYDETLQTPVGDVFSVNWMQDAEKENLTEETLQDQYDTVRSETHTSHVEEYGDLDIGFMNVSDFMGSRSSASQASNYLHARIDVNDVVSCRDVPIFLLQRKKEAATKSEEQQSYEIQIQNLLKNRQHMEKVIDDILLLATGMDEPKLADFKLDKYKLKLNDFDCYKNLVSSFSENCFEISKNPHAFSQLYLFANICGQKDIEEESVVKAITDVCSTHLLPVGIN